MQGNVLRFSLVGSDPLLSIPPHWLSPQDAFGGPRATERDWQRCQYGGERGEAVPVTWHQETAKKCKLKTKKKKPSKAPVLVPVLGSSASAPGVRFGARGKCHLGAGDTSPGEPRSRKRGVGGVWCSLGVWGIFGGVPAGPFSWVVGRAAVAGSTGRSTAAHGVPGHGRVLGVGGEPRPVLMGRASSQVHGGARHCPIYQGHGRGQHKAEAI